MAEQPPLVGQADVGAVAELAGAAEVVHERRGQEQVRVQPRVQLADLVGQGRHRDGVLEQAAEIRVMTGAGARSLPPRRAQNAVAEHRLEQSPVAPVVDLAGQMLEEAVELVEVAVGGGQERGRIEIPASVSAERAGCRSPRPPARRGSARPCRPPGPGPRARSAPPAHRRLLNTRAGIVPVRSRSSSAR